MWGRVVVVVVTCLSVGGGGEVVGVVFSVVVHAMVVPVRLIAKYRRISSFL